MSEWSAKQKSQNKEGAALKANKFKDDSDSIEESSELGSKNKDKGESYESDNFEDISQS